MFFRFNTSFNIFLFFFCASIFAQVKYPKDSSYINVINNSEKNQHKGFTIEAIDTTIDNYHLYSPRNTSGNIGLPSFPLLFQYKNYDVGFKLYDNPYVSDIINTNQVNFYQTKGPYASLTGIAGSKQEQLFRMLFANTFKNKLNLSLGFNRYSSMGFYAKQQSFTNNFFSSSNYTSSNGRYGYYAYFLFNKLKHQENGGISNDTFFLQNVMINKQLLPVNLFSAKTDFRTSQVEINPWFRINKNSDSLSILDFFLNYKFKYQGDYLKYTDEGIASENYYNLIYLDTVITRDSIHWIKISNQLNGLIHFKPKNLKLNVGIENEMIQLYQRADTNFQNNILHASFMSFQKQISSYINAQYVLSGINQSDYKFEFLNSYTTKNNFSILKSKLRFNLKFNTERRQPNYQQLHWYSNHFIWNQSFKQTEKTEALISALAINQRFEIGTLIQNHNHFIYFDEQATPFQTNSSVQNISLFVKKHTLLFNHLGINFDYHYQVSSYQALFPLPNHVLIGSLFYQTNIKKSMLLQIGFTAHYFSEYDGYGYMPALNSFYLKPGYTSGNYPFIDFFINARVKPVRFFLKIDHLNQGLTGTGYNMAPGYLQNDRAFKFGLNWLFFD